METYDIVMLAVLGLATLFGFLKGFAWQVASLASLILSYLMALRFGDALAPQLNVNPAYSKYVAMLVIYAGTSLFVWLGFRVVSGAIDRIKLREFDRQIGGLFGLLKGALFCVVITFFAVTLTETSRAAVLKSKSGGHIARLLHEAKPVMPPELSELLGPYLDKLDQGLDPTQTVNHPVPNPSDVQQQLQQFQNALPQNFGPPPQFDPSRANYPTYSNGNPAPATYPPPAAYQLPPANNPQSGQNYVPFNR